MKDVECEAGAGERGPRSPLVRLRLALRALLIVLALATSAFADSRTDFLIQRLAYPPPAGQTDDFRVRTNAALALGATNDDGAVAPLCRALRDPSEVVRQAAAAALKRLVRRSSLDCLRDRLNTESNGTVRLQITRAIDTIDKDAPGAPSSDDSTPEAPKFIPTAKYYVSLSTVTNRTGRAQSEVERIVLDGIRERLESTGDHQLAPIHETPQAAKALVAKRKLKGYYLMITVEPFEYSDSGLRVRVKAAVFSYPNKDLKGEVPASATPSGIRQGDTSAEDNLMSALARRSADLFAQNFR